MNLFQSYVFCLPLGFFPSYVTVYVPPDLQKLEVILVMLYLHMTNVISISIHSLLSSLFVITITIITGTVIE